MDSFVSSFCWFVVVNFVGSSQRNFVYVNSIQSGIKE